jgi:hypothetical protein
MRVAPSVDVVQCEKYRLVYSAADARPSVMQEHRFSQLLQFLPRTVPRCRLLALVSLG